jgi:hypothetical protein
MSLPDINTFKSGLSEGGARANYYIVQGLLPDPTAARNLNFLCRSASLPVANVNVVEVMTPGGRKLKVSGERTFDNWTITVYNDTAMRMRKSFEIWQVKSGLYSSPIAYDSLDSYAAAAGWRVWQLSRSGQAVHGYNFYNCWPARLGEISLSYDEAGSIEEFEVELAFSHYIPQGKYSSAALAAGVTELKEIFGELPSGGGGIKTTMPKIPTGLEAFEKATTSGGGGGGTVDAETGTGQ